LKNEKKLIRKKKLCRLTVPNFFGDVSGNKELFFYALSSTFPVISNLIKTCHWNIQYDHIPFTGSQLTFIKLQPLILMFDKTCHTDRQCSTEIVSPPRVISLSVREATLTCVITKMQIHLPSPDKNTIFQGN